MEYQFQKQNMDYLREVLWNTRTEEQTQEVKLNDTMPDIGKVICAWGQPLVRSKEWRGNTMGITGGVMAWVLYTPEDGSEPRCVESWIPFQLRWDIPQSKRDGFIRTEMRICDMDARSTSARKLMLRAVISAVAEAMEPTQAEVFEAQQVPEDVQLQQKSYPVTLAKEAGERTVTLEEELSLPSQLGPGAKLINCVIQPLVTEKKVMGDKLVFRGTTQLHCRWLTGEGHMQTTEHELPFSQYGDLAENYGPQAMADLIPAVTNLETELSESGNLLLKAGIVGQYVVFDTQPVTVITDAYSLRRPVEQQRQLLELPALLDIRQATMRAEVQLPAELGETPGGKLLLSQPEVRREDNGVTLELGGLLQLPVYGEEGSLQCISQHWDGCIFLPGDPDNAVRARICATGNVRITHGGETGAVCDVTMDAITMGKLGLNMVTALELGEEAEPDPGRPSYVLMRCGDAGLWDLAKICGSTVDAIEEANGLAEEPMPGRMLLIPVL